MKKNIDDLKLGRHRIIDDGTSIDEDINLLKLGKVIDDENQLTIKQVFDNVLDTKNNPFCSALQAYNIKRCPDLYDSSMKRFKLGYVMLFRALLKKLTTNGTLSAIQIESLKESAQILGAELEENARKNTK